MAADMPVKAPEVPVEAPWWWHGIVEVGGRGFLNDPARGGATQNPFRAGGSAYLGQQSLAKYYEYSDIKPGPFSNIWITGGSGDGLYRMDMSGENIGYNDQRYFFDWSKAGEYYLTLGWDQLPHTYSTSAYTPYLGIGNNFLFLPPGVGAAVKAAGNTSPVLPFLHQTDIGIRRDTASAEYRWTPTDAWDVRANLEETHRTGTQVGSIMGAGGTFGYGPIMVPKPVDDNTANYGVNGEWVGTSPWSQRMSFKAGYKGSTYDDGFAAFQVQNPFCSGTTAASCSVATRSPFLQESLWPSNQMNAINGTLSADLPWKSKYVGTVSYTRMTQNSQFIPMTNNPSAPAALNVLPASSLNGEIDTLLSNNVVTTDLGSDVRSKFTYRYYDFHNGTPMIMFGTPGSLTGWTSYDQSVAGERAIQSLSMAYTKQNLGDEITWRPSREWNLGAAYGYERYNYTQVDVDVTNENSAKLFADYKPWNWLTVRSTGQVSSRRYNNYNYDQFVGFLQFPGSTPAVNSFFYSSAYRQLMIDNRDMARANLFVDFVAAPGLTITPTFQWRDENYLLGFNEYGLKDRVSWTSGVDVTYLVMPTLTVSAGYLWERASQSIIGVDSTSNQALWSPATPSLVTDDVATVHTFTAGAKWAAVPSKLDIDLRYAASIGRDSQVMTQALGTAAFPTCVAGTPAVIANPCAFPDDTTLFQRLDATAIYTVDPDWVTQMGWRGVVKAKLRYTWERNSVANWQNDSLAVWNPVVQTQGIYLAWNNPNYNVHMLSGSVSWAW